VSPYALNDFRYDASLKRSTDENVEKEVQRRLEDHCKEAKQRRQGYLSQSKKFADDD